MAADPGRSTITVRNWPGLHTNTGPMASVDPGSAVTIINLTIVASGDLVTRSGMRRVLFDEPIVAVITEISMEIGSPITGTRGDGSVLYSDDGSNLAISPDSLSFFYDHDGSIGPLLTPRMLYIGDGTVGSNDGSIAFYDAGTDTWFPLRVVDGLTGTFGSAGGGPSGLDGTFSSGSFGTG